MCKVHKDGYPLRPVVSMIGTAEYELAKYLDDLIRPNIPTKFMVNSNTQFLDELKKVELCPTDCMVSFDVKSLFTNVPLNETINLVADSLYD